MFTRSAADSRAVVVRSALEEARRRGDRRLGTDHLLLGLLHDPDSSAARALGTDLESARAALDALDRAALASIGIEVGGLQPTGVAPSRKRPPLTSAARSVLFGATREAAHTKTRRPTANHLLLALLACRPPDPAAELLAQLGIDRSAARDALT